ncbi:MAG: M55 family metallopeptidase [Candidatus Bipolaricaulota bacterium]|nr:MAG: M55 family metallopeptidase [Candidatus Bipolaricaulota bacterium]
MPSRRKRQLYVLCDMEGASGISPANREAMRHGSDLWRAEGRGLVTSDVAAVCSAAQHFGIEEIILNDSHDYGVREPNVLLKQLPGNVRLVRRPYLPGKPRKMVRGEPYGIVIVGQHARYGGGGFAPHTIQSPPIGVVTLNGTEVGEIGLELALFMRAPLLAVIGEEAAVAEARALCPGVVGVPVKSLARDWFPSAGETAPVIREGVLDALRRRDEMHGLELKPPFRFTLAPATGHRFNPERRFFTRWLARLILLRLSRGKMCERGASWETRTIVGGLYALHSARGFIEKAG